MSLAGIPGSSDHGTITRNISSYLVPGHLSQCIPVPALVTSYSYTRAVPWGAWVREDLLDGNAEYLRTPAEDTCLRLRHQHAELPVLHYTSGKGALCSHVSVRCLTEPRASKMGIAA